MNRFTRGAYFPIGLNPEGLDTGQDLADRPPQNHLAAQARVRFEGGVYFQIPMINGDTLLIGDHFQKRKADDHLSEEQAIALLTVLQGDLGPLAAGVMSSLMAMK